MAADPDETVLARRRNWVDSLYRRYSQSLWRFLCRRRVSADEAADIVQEAYCRMQRLTDVDSINSPRAFLFRVAHNLAQNERKHGRVVSGQGTVDPDSVEIMTDAPSAYRVLKGEQELAIARAAFAQLSPKCRRALLLHRFENRSYREIADELGVSVSMIEKYISQAMAHIRSRLTEAEGVPGLKTQRKQP